MKKNKKPTMSWMYSMTSKSKRIIAGVIGGVLVLATVLGAVASVFM